MTFGNKHGGIHCSFHSNLGGIFSWKEPRERFPVLHPHSLQAITSYLIAVKRMVAGTQQPPEKSWEDSSVWECCVLACAFWLFTLCFDCSVYSVSEYSGFQWVLQGIRKINRISNYSLISSELSLPPLFFALITCWCYRLWQASCCSSVWGGNFLILLLVI